MSNDHEALQGFLHASTSQFIFQLFAVLLGGVNRYGVTQSTVGYFPTHQMVVRLEPSLVRK